VFFGLAYILEWVTFSWVQVLILTAVVFVLAVLVYYVDFVVPMTRVLDQVKAILTGRRYKKIYSDRTDEIGIFAHFFNELTGSY
jgi:nitrate/nitrite-specific signal transduction histidine kinase